MVFALLRFNDDDFFTVLMLDYFVFIFRLHIVEEFNRDIYDYIIASDESVFEAVASTSSSILFRNRERAPCRVEFRGLIRDCQLTFERYCIIASYCTSKDKQTNRLSPVECEVFSG